MFSWLLPKADEGPALPPAPQGSILYAVGDIHGRLDLLAGVQARIDADRLQAGRSVRTVEVYLGDYVDRGPDSCGVIANLIARGRQVSTVCLRGNHETMLEDFLAGGSKLEDFRRFGGVETALSYGVDAQVLRPGAEDAPALAAMRQAFPPAHRRFLEQLKPSFEAGGYIFAHAGVRPGVALENQSLQDLTWIREDFLHHEGDFGRIVVHGHTPVPKADFRANRINIDTGAFATGVLTCLRIGPDGPALLDGGLPP